MITDKYITADELSEIQTACRTLNDLRTGWARNLKNLSIGIFIDAEGFDRTFPVQDSNGDIVGHIGMADDGYAFYLDNGEENA